MPNLPFLELTAMECEKLTLEVKAQVTGLTVIKPPFVVGSSGVRHRFTFVASRNRDLFAFDICEKVGAVEVIRTFAKALDTGVKACIINLGGRIDSETLQLASAYRISILGPADLLNSFAREAVQVQSASVREREPIMLEV
jgi:hypothetical protein